MLHTLTSTYDLSISCVGHTHLHLDGKSWNNAKLYKHVDVQLFPFPGYVSILYYATLSILYTSWFAIFILFSHIMAKKILLSSCYSHILQSYWGATLCSSEVPNFSWYGVYKFIARTLKTEWCRILYSNPWIRKWIKMELD